MIQPVTERRLGVGLAVAATHVGHGEAPAADVHGDLFAESIAVLVDVQEKDGVISEVGVVVPLEDRGQLQWGVEGDRDRGVGAESIEAVGTACGCVARARWRLPR